MRLSEALAVAYFIYLALVALAVRLPRVSTVSTLSTFATFATFSPGRRLRVWLAAGLVVAIEIGVARVPATPSLEAFRDWLPAFVILFAYFVTGLFFVAPSAHAEAWLKRWDDRLIGPRRFESVPRVLRVYLDVVYDACFLIIPAGFAVLVWAGHSERADRYWTLVSAAEFLPFGTLPWFQARPPWAIEARRAIDSSGVSPLQPVMGRQDDHPCEHVSERACLGVAGGRTGGVARGAVGRRGAGRARRQHCRRLRGRPISLRHRCGHWIGARGRTLGRHDRDRAGLKAGLLIQDRVSSRERTTTGP